MKNKQLQSVTPESQRAHIANIKHIATKLNRVSTEADLLPTITVHLSLDELDTIQRALACHMAIITLDMEKRGLEI